MLNDTLKVATFNTNSIRSRDCSMQLKNILNRCKKQEYKSAWRKLENRPKTDTQND